MGSVREVATQSRTLHSALRSIVDDAMVMSDTYAAIATTRHAVLTLSTTCVPAKITAPNSAAKAAPSTGVGRAASEPKPAVELASELI